MHSGESGGRLDVYSFDDGTEVYADRLSAGAASSADDEQSESGPTWGTVFACVDGRCERPERVGKLIDGIDGDLEAVIAKDGSGEAGENVVGVVKNTSGVDINDVMCLGPPVKSESNDEDGQNVFGKRAQLGEVLEDHGVDPDNRKPLTGPIKIDDVKLRPASSEPGHLSVLFDKGNARALSVGPADTGTAGVGIEQLRQTYSFARNPPCVDNVAVAHDYVPYSALVGADEFYEYVDAEERSFPDDVSVPAEDEDSIVEAVSDGGDGTTGPIDEGSDAVNVTVLNRGRNVSEKSVLVEQASGLSQQERKEIKQSDVAVEDAVPSVDATGVPVLHAAVNTGFENGVEVETHQSVEEALDAVGRAAEERAGDGFEVP